MVLRRVYFEKMESKGKKSAKFWLKADGPQLKYLRESIRVFNTNCDKGCVRHTHPYLLDPRRIFFNLSVQEIFIQGFGTFEVYKTGNQPFIYNKVSHKAEIGIESGRVFLRVYFRSKTARAPISFRDDF